jgi:hypothetical protein
MIEEKKSTQVDRRTFVKQAGLTALGVASIDASSYARILGSNDRISLGQPGCGSRSAGHVHMAQLASQQTKVEVVAVCDIWNLVGERRGAHVEEALHTNDRVLAVPHGILGSRVQEMSGQDRKAPCPASRTRETAHVTLIVAALPRADVCRT